MPEVKARLSDLVAACGEMVTDDVTEYVALVVEKSPREKYLDEIRHRFTYHPPKGDQLERYTTIRDRGCELALFLVEHTPASREQSLALTKIEEAIMYANAAIARHE